MNPPDIHLVKPGALITFVYGPGESPLPEFAQHKGRAYGIRKSRFGDSLRVKMEDFTFKYVSSFSKVGIGAYLPAEVVLARGPVVRGQEKVRHLSASDLGLEPPLN